MRWCQAVGAALLVCAAGYTARGDSIVVNGSFEAPIVQGSWDTYHAPSVAVSGWVLQSGSIDHIGGYWQAAEGVQSLDMNGNTTAGGSIYQDLSTVAGQEYTLSFAIAGNPDGPPVVKTLEVKWGGGAVATVSSDTTGNTRANMGWETHSFTVVASGATSRLEFTSQDQGFYGAALDNVRVTAVPLPGTMSGAAALLAMVGLVRRRR